jgi:transposase-like protein
MLNLKGMRFPIDVILVCIRWYAAYPLSYRHLEEIMEERGVSVDHSTINRWAIRFLPLIETMARKSKRPVGGSWRMDETYIKVKGAWKYLYRAVDKQGKTVDFLLTAKRDMAAAKRFFDKAMGANADPDKVAMDKSGDRCDQRRPRRADPCAPGEIPQQHCRKGPSRHQAGDQADAQLQIVPCRQFRARRNRTDAHDPQGPVRNRWRRWNVVRRPIFCAGRNGPFSLSGVVSSRGNPAV